MPSSSTLSDVHPAKVLAREQHHILQPPSTPPPKARQDSTLYISIGSHLIDTPEPDSWPASIENFTDEASLPTYPLARTISDASMREQTGVDSGMIEEGHLTSRGRPRLVDIVYLTAPEYKLFYHQHKNGRNMRSTDDQPSEPSPTRASAPDINAVEYLNHPDEARERSNHVQTAFSVSHTTPPMSVYTTEGDTHVFAQLPGLDGPWSSINTMSESRHVEEKLANSTVSHGNSEHFRTPVS
ncbi:hypothetical protein IAQ61_001949 [Plenodomus lingam]|uniref:Uncharacterized protein n=1 Tax=Leptosphaeria maculans (strain JN3 / isolate v23.1.3 / race Av1-4-5-6-7-8) TaxID=985895 RepID=E4ZGM1_LEPMJ|nr:predicted protein [Plenodomus lingam JN3]KAH9878676.1 hypothetical protein IAQ61_001949 [Plenodomus lingam]CBX90441.1 predicted protein [Plenodomus lingam JN3]